MEMSPEIGEIAGALAKAQAGLGALIASKTAKIPTKKGKDYSYTYANLADALDACRSTLNGEGIAVIQLPATPQGQGIEVVTMLVHSSGQWLRSDPLFMPVSGGAQDVGSAITYARRYSLLAMVGLAPEDDDGAKAQSAKPDSWGDRRATQRRTQPPSEPRISAEGIEAIEGHMTLICEAEGHTMGEVWEGLSHAVKGSPIQVGEACELTRDEGRRVYAAAQVWLTELQGEAG